MTTLVYSTHIRRPSRFRSLINLIGTPLLLILIILLHYPLLMSLEITPGMSGGSRTPTEAHPPQIVFPRPCFRPSPHTPARPSSTHPSIPLRACSLTLVSPFRSTPPLLHQRQPFDVALSQWSELQRGILRIPPPRTHAIPRRRISLQTTPRPRRRESAQMRNNCES
jgi:hypothetical protein